MYILAAAFEGEVKDLVSTEKANLLITGIGKLNAAYSLAECFRIHGDKIKAVINLGTAGSQVLEPGSMVEVTRCFQRDTAFFSAAIELKKQTSLPEAFCASGDQVAVFSENDPWQVVDMELFSLADFCKRKGISLVSIKYVTDRNEGNIVKEWKKELPKANVSLSHFWMNQKQQILSKLCANVGPPPVR
jgi:nucleoside phosphorylase